jgi:hypothetical protein
LICPAAYLSKPKATSFFISHREARDGNPQRRDPQNHYIDGPPLSARTI